MAGPNTPDPGIENAARLALINSGNNSSNKPGFIGPIPLNWDASGGLALKAVSFMDKPIAPLLKGPGKAGGMADKFLTAMQSVPDQLKQMASQAGIMYQGDLPSGSILNSNAGGGTFASNLSGAGQSGSIEIG